MGFPSQTASSTDVWVRNKLEMDWSTYKNMITLIYLILLLKRPIDFGILCVGVFLGMR